MTYIYSRLEKKNLRLDDGKFSTSKMGFFVHSMNLLYLNRNCLSCGTINVRFWLIVIVMQDKHTNVSKSVPTSNQQLFIFAFRFVRVHNLYGILSCTGVGTSAMPCISSLKQSHDISEIVRNKYEINLQNNVHGFNRPLDHKSNNTRGTACNYRPDAISVDLQPFSPQATWSPSD